MHSYLSDRRYKPALERVCIDEANDSDFDSEDDDDDRRKSGMLYLYSAN